MRVFKKNARWIGAGLLVMALATCGQRPPTYPRAPLILISIDTLRSDHLSAYGYQALETPAIDALARDAVLYERAYAHYPLTLPSHASLFTGKLTPNIGVRNNAGFQLNDEYETLAEALKSHGYQTAGVISSMVLKQSTGVSQGFDFFDDDLGIHDENRIRMFAQRGGDQAIDSAKKWLQSRGEAPFFLFLHLYEPHAPYEAPEPFASSHASPYDAEIAYTDHLLADFFQFLKQENLYDPSLIVFLSDHGEGLGEHGEEEHGVLLYRESLQVPLIVKFPRAENGGRRVAAPVGLIDIKPSILNILDLSGASSEGMNIFGETHPPTNRLLFAETLYPLYQFGWCSSRSVIRGDLHYLEICEPELYDLSQDPQEQEDLFGKRSTPRDMVALMESMGEGLKAETQNTQEDLELLASLGYTGGVVGVDQANALDPKAGMAIFKQLDTAKQMLADKKFAEAEAFVVPLIQQNPALNDGRYLLIQALVEQEKFEQAEYVCLDGLGYAPNHLNYLIAMTTIKLRLKKPEEAYAVAKKAFEVDLDVAGTQLLIPLYNEGNVAMAVHYANQCIQKYTETALSVPYARLVLGRHARQNGDYRGAIPHLETCIRLADKIRSSRSLTMAYHALGDCYGRIGQEEKAVPLIKKSLEIEPDFVDGHTTLSYLYASMKDPRRAVGALDEWLINFPSRANFERASQVADRMGLKTKANLYLQEAKKYPQVSEDGPSQR